MTIINLALNVDVSSGEVEVIADGTTKYVSTTGLETNPGTIDQPWALAKLRNNVCNPGDTVYLRGGTYTGAFVLAQAGTAAAPVTVQNYPGEHVVLDRARAVRDDGLDGLRIEGVYQTLRENTTGTFTLLNSATQRELSGTDAVKGRPGGLRFAVGRGHKIINIRVRDVGYCTWDQGALDLDAHGVIFRCIGWDDADSVPNARGHGPPLYVQNKAGTGRKKFTQCVSVNNYTHDVHVFGGSSTKLADVDFDACTLALSSASSHRVRIGEPFIAAGETGATTDAVVDGITLRRSVIYQRFDYPSDGGIGNPCVRLGTVQPPGHTPQVHGAIEISDCELVGPLLVQEECPHLRYRGNRINGQGRPGGTPPIPIYEYFRGSPAAVFAANAAFQAKYTDGNSYYSDLDAVLTTKVAVEANEYEEGRGHITIVNWQSQPVVSVDVSAICEQNKSYDLFDLENDSVVDAFTYTGALLPISMSRAPAANPVGGTIRDTRRSGTRFGVFLVRRTA